MVNRFLVVLISLLAMACNKQSREYGDGTLGVEVAVSASSSISTRTSVDLSDRVEDATTGSYNSLPVRWERDDKFYLWAQNSDGNYAFEGVEFAIRQFYDTYTNAKFIGTLGADMPEDQYTYYGIYPAPLSVSGTQVSFDTSLPQNGKYNGQLDIMRVKQSGGKLNANDENVLSDLSLNFSHLMHVMEITIPEGRMYFDGINRIEIDFPQSVVGELAFDATDHNAPVVSNATSSHISLTFDENLNEGDTFFVFINPTTLDGDITFQCFNDNLTPNRYTTPVSIGLSNRQMRGGEITPVKLTVADEYDYERTHLALRFDNNYLGENPTKITIEVPSAMELYNESGDTYKASGNKIVYPITNWSEQKNKQIKIQYQSHLYEHILKDKDAKVTVSYESKSANVVGYVTGFENIVYDGDVSEDANNIGCDIPYLFFENFDSVNADFENNTAPGISSTGHHTLTLSGYGLSGWTADRCGGVANTSIRTMVRLEGGAGVQYKYRGRIDSAPFSNLRSGAKVNVKITFDYGGAKEDGVGRTKGTPQFDFGFTDDKGKLSGGTYSHWWWGDNGDACSVENVLQKNIQQGSNGSYSEMPNKNKTFTTTGDKVYNLTRLTWNPNVSRSRETGQNGNYWLFIDNVRVSIYKDVN